jgi:hypothetical protein
LSRVLGEAVDDEPAESSADATHAGVLTAPPIPRAMASAPTRPMYLDASAENMTAFRGDVICITLVTHVTRN